MVFVTTPPHPTSNARRMFCSDSVGGADESRNGFSNWRPVNETAHLDMCHPRRALLLTIIEQVAAQLSMCRAPAVTPSDGAPGPVRRFVPGELHVETSDPRSHPGGRPADRSLHCD